MKNIVIIFLLGFFFCACKDSPEEVQHVYTLEECMPYIKSIEYYNQNNFILRYIYDFSTNEQGLITRKNIYRNINRNDLGDFYLYYYSDNKLISGSIYYGNITVGWYRDDSINYTYDGERLKSESYYTSGCQVFYEYGGNFVLKKKYCGGKI
jgi:hypothetical protein